MSTGSGGVHQDSFTRSRSPRRRRAGASRSSPACQPRTARSPHGPRRSGGHPAGSRGGPSGGADLLGDLVVLRARAPLEEPFKIRLLAAHVGVDPILAGLHPELYGWLGLRAVLWPL